MKQERREGFMQTQPTKNNVRHPAPLQPDTEALMDLWRYCFQDNEEFIQWYFHNCYQNQYTYTIKESRENHIAAALQCNPYHLHIRGKNIEVPYITGVCTHPAYRGDGYFQTLFQEVLQKLHEKEIPVAILLPIATDLYAQYQFAYYNHRLDYTLTMADIQHLAALGPKQYKVQLCTQPQQYWYLFQEVYKQYTKNLHGYVYRTEKNWQNLMTDWQMEQCHCAIFFQNNQAIAYLIYQIKEDTITMQEMAYVSPDAYSMIWHYLYQHRTQGEKIIWSAPENDQLLYKIPHWQNKCRLHPFMMARILHVEAMLTQISYPATANCNLYLKVTDPIIAANNQIFAWQVANGQGTMQPTAISPKEYCTITIAALTQLVMGKATAKDLQLQNDLQGTEKQIAQIDAAFPRTHNFINEFF